VRLSELAFRTPATVTGVDDAAPNDAIARRLRELGFVNGEAVEVVAAGPVGAEPLLVQIGFTRFALRRQEAARVRVRTAAEGAGAPTHDAARDAALA
jgi:ferrous iron transport protein A